MNRPTTPRRARRRDSDGPGLWIALALTAGLILAGVILINLIDDGADGSTSAPASTSSASATGVSSSPDAEPEPVTLDSLAKQAGCDLEVHPQPDMLAIETATCVGVGQHVEISLFADAATRDQYVEIGKGVGGGKVFSTGPNWVAFADVASEQLLRLLGGS